MILDIPFYPNKGDGKQCAQACMQSVLKYYLDKEFSLEELDKLTERNAGMWTTNFQTTCALHEIGLKAILYTMKDINSFLNGEPYIREYFGKHAEKILKHTEIPVLIKFIKKILRLNIYEKKRLSFDEIAWHIREGHVIIVPLDWNKITGKLEPYQGHMVIVTGFDDENAFFHHNGPNSPEANKKVKIETFIEAWSAQGAENDAIIIFGKR